MTTTSHQLIGAYDFASCGLVIEKPSLAALIQGAITAGELDLPQSVRGGWGS